MSYTLSSNEVVQRMRDGAVVVDVMTPEEYAAGHVKGAQNACIYEMVFLDRIAECVPDRATELIVYDATGSTSAAGLARDRLLQAGYRSVSVLSGGFAAWRAAGLPTEMGEAGVGGGPGPKDGSYRIEVENSRLEWIGRNLNNRHYGRIAIQSGALVIAGGRPAAGSVVLDMTTLSNLDLEDPAWHDMLIRHLKSDDFFAVERFPTASFTLTGWKARQGGSPEAPEGVATGDLSIREVTRSVSFPAIVAPQPDGSIKAHALLDIDRTLWNVCYGSCRLFERLGMHLVHDTMTLELFIVARSS
jgi:rhodanese-related sulfurtransferase/polyisoprenoid-binding protein YceI